MNSENLCLWSNKSIELIDVANNDIVLAVLAQQKSLDNAETVRHILGTTVGPRFVVESSLVEECVAVLLRDRG